MIDGDGDAACLRHAGGVDQQPVRQVHHRAGKWRDQRPFRQARARAAIGVDQRAGRGGIGAGEFKADACVADRPGGEEPVARPRAGAAGHGTGGLADGGQAVAARRPGRHLDRIAAQQGHGMAIQRLAQSFEKGRVPRLVPGERIVEQAADRPCPLGRQVRQIDRRQLPANVGRRVGGEIMNALDDRVAGEDEPRVADRQQRDIVHQALRGRIMRQEAQQGEEAGFSGHEAKIHAPRACPRAIHPVRTAGLSASLTRQVRRSPVTGHPWRRRRAGR